MLFVSLLLVILRGTDNSRHLLEQTNVLHKVSIPVIVDGNIILFNVVLKELEMDKDGEVISQAQEFCHHQGILTPGCAETLRARVLGTDLIRAEDWGDPNLAGIIDRLDDPTDQQHRFMVGGLDWEGEGKAQLEFLVLQGLQPHHTMIDVGCGSLRAGVHLIRYLQPLKYYGIDINPTLLEAGYRKEVMTQGLHTRLPRQHLRHTTR